MSHAVVFWTEENKYSVIGLQKVVYDKDLITNPMDLIGRSFPVKWKKTRFNGEVKAIGDKTSMKEQEGFWETVAANASFSIQDVEEAQDLCSEPPDKRICLSSTQSNALVQSDLEKHLSLSSENSPDIAAESQRRVIEEEVLEEEIMEGDSQGTEHLKELLKTAEEELIKEKAKNKNLRRLLNKCIPTDNMDGLVSIGEGVTISKGFDDFIKASFNINPSVFLRRLVFDAGVMTLEEVAACSITGTKTVHSNGNPRPALDPVKFKVLKDYTIKCCDLKPNTVEMLKFESKIRSICTDARKKIKKMEGKLVNGV